MLSFMMYYVFFYCTVLILLLKNTRKLGYFLEAGKDYWKGQVLVALLTTP